MKRKRVSCERDWERTVTVSRLAKQMTGTTVRISTVADGFECNCNEHLKKIAKVSCERVMKIVSEIVKEQHESYVISEKVLIVGVIVVNCSCFWLEAQSLYIEEVHIKYQELLKENLKS